VEHGAESDEVRGAGPGAGPAEGPRPRLTLVLGGARSGKSTFAERLAKQLAAPHGGRVTYLATSETNDPEMAARVARHRAARPETWTTVECPLAVAAAVRAHATTTGVFLLDCVTFWTTNLLFSGGALGGSRPPDEGFNYDDSLLAAEQEEAAAQRVQGGVEDLLAALADTGSALIAVSNEVGLGVVPEYPLARLFRDELGRANQRLAAAADKVYLLSAGIVLDLKSLAVDPFSPKEHHP
jgi:adenosylcobinamide kinase/adenosylcobinamide-phosphate guanylyltransferase